MKTRNGFVSNSSSSSFCILGFEATPEESGKSVSSKFIKHEFAIADWDDTEYLGAHPDQMKDDETLLQFKTRIIESLKECGINREVKDLQWITDGGYNG